MALSVFTFCCVVYQNGIVFLQRQQLSLSGSGEGEKIVELFKHSSRIDHWNCIQEVLGRLELCRILNTKTSYSALEIYHALFQIIYSYPLPESWIGGHSLNVITAVRF